MSHFSPKSLSLYGVAITTVVVVFNFVSAYGESKLKAPPSLEGLYPLETNNLPECLQSNNLTLNIQQSGIYLRGQLLPKSSETSSENIQGAASFLNGKWNNQQINLSGSLSQFPDCKNEIVTLQGSLQNNTLTGKLNFNNTSEVINFTAQKEESKKEAAEGH